MRAVLPRPKSLDRAHPVHSLEALEARRRSVTTDPQGYVSQRVARLDQALTRVQPRQVKPGNISMHQHLLNLRARAVETPELDVEIELARLSQLESVAEQSVVPEVRY